MNINDNQRVTAWTVITEAELAELTATGRLTTDQRRTLAEVFAAEDGDEQFRNAYRWLTAKLAATTGRQPREYPRWVWTRVLGQSSWRETPVAFYQHHVGVYALVELNLAHADVLLSDYEAWHAPLNNWYLAVDEEDDAAFDNWLTTPAATPTEVTARKRASWARCLAPVANNYLSSGDTTQGVTWEFNRADVTFAATFAVTAEDLADYGEGSSTLAERLVTTVVG